MLGCHELAETQPRPLNGHSTYQRSHRILSTFCDHSFYLFLTLYPSSFGLLLIMANVSLRQDSTNLLPSVVDPQLIVDVLAHLVKLDPVGNPVIPSSLAIFHPVFLSLYTLQLIAWDRPFKVSDFDTI